jgi:hypothetical protein
MLGIIHMDTITRTAMAIIDRIRTIAPITGLIGTAGDVITATIVTTPTATVTIDSISIVG